MKKILTVLAAALALTVSSCTEKTAENAVAPLKVEGTKLYMEGCDTPAVFRGISYGWHNLWPRFYNVQSIQNISKQSGCKIFRAAIGSDDFAAPWNPGCASGYIQDPELAMSCLDNLVEGAVACGSYIIVDWHSHITYPAEALEFFDKVSKKYADCPNVIYELFNEPVCASFETPERKYDDLGNPEAMQAYWKSLKAYAEPIIKVIDENSNVHPLILMGCPSWDQRIDLPAADPITTYDNLMYTVHFYAATHKEDLRAATSAAIAAGCPVFISECAGCDASGDGDIDPVQWKAWCDWADANDVTMMTWSVGDKNETCSMFTPEASSEGPWDENEIKPWTVYVLDWINNK